MTRRLIAEELEERDYYTEKNVFWVPALARWDHCRPRQAAAGHRDRGQERQDARPTSSPPSAGSRRRARRRREGEPEAQGRAREELHALQIDPANLGELIDLIATSLRARTLHAKDILGHVYEYFLGQFALAEGKKGGQYYTPKSIVTLIVEMLQPYQGRVYDPAWAPAASSCSREKFIEEHGGRIGQALRLRAGVQPHHLAARRDEHGHPRHRLRLRQGTGQHLHQRPAPRPARRLTSWPTRPST